MNLHPLLETHPFDPRYPGDPEDHQPPHSTAAKMMTEEERNQLTNDIAAVLNKHSAENHSNTPDYILAGFLVGCLETWNHHTRQRSYWTGEEMRPSI